MDYRAVKTKCLVGIWIWIIILISYETLEHVASLQQTRQREKKWCSTKINLNGWSYSTYGRLYEWLSAMLIQHKIGQHSPGREDTAW